MIGLGLGFTRVLAYCFGLVPRIWPSFSSLMATRSAQRSPQSNPSHSLLGLAWVCWVCQSPQKAQSHPRRMKAKTRAGPWGICLGPNLNPDLNPGFLGPDFTDTLCSRVIYLPEYVGILRFTYGTTAIFSHHCDVESSCSGSFYIPVL